MAKKKMSKKEILSVFLIILGGLFILATPFILVAVLHKIFPLVDAYLLTGFSFCIFGFVALLAIPIVLFRVFMPKKEKGNYIKGVFKRHKKFVIFFVLPATIIFILFETAIVYRASEYYKDMAQGPKDKIMLDVVVEKHSHKNGSSKYIVGYVNGEKIQLEVTGDAYSQIEKNGSYKMLRIKYYEHIREVYHVDIYMK